MVWIVPLVIIGVVVIVVVGAIALFIGAFVVDDMKKKMQRNISTNPPSPPAIPATMPEGGFRPSPSTRPTQPDFNELVRQVRKYQEPSTQPTTDKQP